MPEAMRPTLLKKFPPKYPVVKCDHITIQTARPVHLPRADHIDIIGHADSGDGLEAMLVEVDGTTKRSDGSHFHITWSLDADKYRAADSNRLITKFLDAGKIVYLEEKIALGPAQAIYEEDPVPGRISAVGSP